MKLGKGYRLHQNPRSVGDCNPSSISVGLEIHVLVMPKSKLLDRIRLIANRLKCFWCSSSTTDAYPVFPPPNPEDLLAQPNLYRERLFQRVHRVPKGKNEDRPLFSLYRLYEHLVLNDNVGLRNELEYFWYAKWPVASIPDPEDPSPSRYAVLSAIPALLVQSFNERIKLGLPRKADCIVSREELEEYAKEDKVFETVPEWTEKVAPLEETLVVPHDDGQILESFEDQRASAQLAMKNVLHWQPHIHFI